MTNQNNGGEKFAWLWLFIIFGGAFIEYFLVWMGW